MSRFEPQLRKAVKFFWKTRMKQSKSQGLKSGVKDAGKRSAVTGGKHLNGFVSLIKELLMDSGISEPDVFWRNNVEIPGYFRATKKWDLLVVSDRKLIVIVEFKAIASSFGNNLNNRTEEALGNSMDFMMAYREGVFGDSIRPWLGYFLLMLDDDESNHRVKVRAPHFKVLEEFEDASYQDRAAILLRKLIRERLYDAACFLTSQEASGIRNGVYSEPLPELAFRNFAESLLARAIAHAKTGD